ncbi:MAG TPA: hypothetical protein VGR13_02385, partial [Actinomycetota bacterium]|nr:hypothetical protein [Actinomycetota bacterium]
MASLTASQRAVAEVIYQLAYNEFIKSFSTRKAAQYATELVGYAYMESGLNPNATNKSSGAAGVFQLLSSGYVNKANSLGGVYNVTANTKAILGSYVSYYKSHPNAVPGDAGRDVERSGASSAWYAQPLSWIGPLIGGVSLSNIPAYDPGAGGSGGTQFGLGGGGLDSGALAGILRGFGINPADFAGLIDQAVRGNWSEARFEAAVYASPAFHEAFPGIFRPDGSLRISPMEYRQLAKQYRKIGADYGIKVDKSRIGMLV